MMSSLSRLAEELDALAETGRVSLTETATVVVANRVGGPDARTVAALCKAAGLDVGVEDGSSSEWLGDPVTLDDAFGPFRLTVEKPSAPDGSAVLLTLSGLEHELHVAAPGSVLRPVRCLSGFDTFRVRVSPVADGTPFEPQPLLARPRRIVRETGDRRRVPEDVGAWLLKDPEGRLPLEGDVAFATWSGLSTVNLLLSLANEASADAVSFRGPPAVTLAMPANGRSPALAADSLRQLQMAAAWVFGNDREAETRQGLFAAEMARACVGERDAVQAFSRLSGSVLSSARIAYQLSLSQVSRDSLKALADLRKAVSDETGKLAESTRTLAGAVTTALFAGLGLVLARLTADLPGGMVAAVGVVLAVYVGSVIASGLEFLAIQRQVRAEWRPRLYSFLEEGEYRAMVEQPIFRAERAYRMAAWRGGTVATLMTLALLAFAAWKAMPIATTAPAPAASATPAAKTVSPLPAPQQPASLQQLPGAASKVPDPASGALRTRAEPKAVVPTGHLSPTDGKKVSPN